MENDDDLNISGSMDDVLKASTKPLQNADKIGKRRQFGYFFNGTKSDEGEFYELPHEVLKERRDAIFKDPENDYEFYAMVYTDADDSKDPVKPLKGIHRVIDKNLHFFFDYDFDKKDIGELEHVGNIREDTEYHIKVGGKFEVIRKSLLKEQVLLELDNVDGKTWFRANIDAGVKDSKGSFSYDLLIALNSLYDMNNP